MRGFGFFFSFGGGFGKARLDFSGGLSNGIGFSFFLDGPFGGAVAFSFLAVVASLNLSNQSFQPAFGMSGSFLGNAIAMVVIYYGINLESLGAAFGMS